MCFQRTRFSGPLSAQALCGLGNTNEFLHLEHIIFLNTPLDRLGTI